MTYKCCDVPSLRREHFAFRWRDDYSCFGGLFPADSCLNCGTAITAFGRVKGWLFGLFEAVLGPWDGAMCLGEHDDV